MSNNKASLALKKKRLDAGLSLRQLADKCGVSRRTISRCEKGDFPSEAKTVKKYVNYLYEDRAERAKIFADIEEELKENKASILSDRKRKKERTDASKKLSCSVSFSPKNDEQEPQAQLAISQKLIGKSVLRFYLSSKKQVFYEYDKNGNKKRQYGGTDAVKFFWLFCTRELQIGHIAALDFAEREVERSSLFKGVEVSEYYVLNSKYKLADLQQKLESIKDVKDNTSRVAKLNKAIELVENLLTGDMQLKEAQEKLLNRIESIRKTTLRIKKHSL